jgi:hypothetical protein
VKPKLLLDSHVPSGVAQAVRALHPSADIQHISTWQNGAYRDAEDDLLLEACWQERRGLVSKDRAPLPGWLSFRISQGKEHAGIIFYDRERFKSDQVGALAKALVKALEHTKGRLLNRWLTLR